MLALRPNCELCDRDLPPESEAARICSYECTFCATCVEDALRNVCPNCGGGFERRPVRPARAWREGVSRNHQPPSGERVRKLFDKKTFEAFAARIEALPPHAR